MHLQPLAIDGVFRASTRRKLERRFDWFRLDALSPALPSGWLPAVGTNFLPLPGHIAGLHCTTDHLVVTCVAGRAALVVVDMRVGATTFGRWIPVDLDTVNRITVVVPPHTAWGFQAATADTAVLCLHRETPPGPQINPLDSDLAIQWPLSAVEPQGASLADILPLLPTLDERSGNS